MNSINSSTGMTPPVQVLVAPVLAPGPVVGLFSSAQFAMVPTMVSMADKSVRASRNPCLVFMFALGCDSGFDGISGFAGRPRGVGRTRKCRSSPIHIELHAEDSFICAQIGVANISTCLTQIGLEGILLAELPRHIQLDGVRCQIRSAGGLRDG